MTHEPQAPAEVLSKLSAEAVQCLRTAELFVLDVDGTLTDGRVIYVGDTESQAFDVQDGQGLVWLRRAGVKLAWISGRGSQPTKRRASELGVEFIELQCKDKTAALRAIQAQLEIDASRTISMGDDMPDLQLAEVSGFFAAPANARPEVKQAAHLVTATSGGQGAVREVCDLILRARDSFPGTRPGGKR